MEIDSNVVIQILRERLEAANYTNVLLEAKISVLEAQFEESNAGMEESDVEEV